MHADSELPPPDWPGQLRPDDGPDPDWPDDWPAPPGPEPAVRRRGPRIVALAVVALVALSAGAGAVFLYQHGLAGSTPPSQNGTAAPGQGSTPGPVPSGGSDASMVLLGTVQAVGRDSVSIGGGPAPVVSALVTSATRFTGSARSLAQVRVGDTVAAQISASNGVARVVSLQDPATAS